MPPDTEKILIFIGIAILLYLHNKLLQFGFKYFIEDMSVKECSFVTNKVRYYVLNEEQVKRLIKTGFDSKGKR